jgi:plastocyanin
MRKPWLAPALLVVAAGMLACGGGEIDLEALATEAADATPSPALTITAKDLEFDRDTLVVPAGSEVTITLRNRDGATHNLAVYAEKGASANLFRGDLFAGDDTKEYRFQSPGAGVYYFRCDAHPEMEGVFIAR